MFNKLLILYLSAKFKLESTMNLGSKSSGATSSWTPMSSIARLILGRFPGGKGGVLPNMGYIGMCGPKG